MCAQIIQHSEEVNDADGGDPMSLGGTLETMHSVDLAHPNVVQTYKSTQRPIIVSHTSRAFVWLYAPTYGQMSLHCAIVCSGFTSASAHVGLLDCMLKKIRPASTHRCTMASCSSSRYMLAGSHDAQWKAELFWDGLDALNRLMPEGILEVPASSAESLQVAAFLYIA